MTISVITPTFGREKFLPGLYRCFTEQTHPDRELLVFDDSPSPSAFFASLRDPRVRYQHTPHRLTIGEKRNQLIEQAQGELIAFFDDDDFYSPDYLRVLAGSLGEADLIKLAGWFALSVPDDALFFWDTSVNHPLHHKVGEGASSFVTSNQFKPDFVAKNIDGYGFSYLFRRAVFGAARFPSKNFAEDVAFLNDLRSQGKRVVHAQDTVGLAVHILHARNTSVIFPQYRLPVGISERLFPGLGGFLAAVK
ncbi:MAG TPA: glycosyltransferase family 2 protein [Polyangia bacterium]